MHNFLINHQMVKLAIFNLSYLLAKAHIYDEHIYKIFSQLLSEITSIRKRIVGQTKNSNSDQQS